MVLLLGFQSALRSPPLFSDMRVTGARWILYSHGSACCKCFCYAAVPVICPPNFGVLMALICRMQLFTDLAVPAKFECTTPAPAPAQLPSP